MPGTAIKNSSHHSQAYFKYKRREELSKDEKLLSFQDTLKIHEKSNQPDFSSPFISIENKSSTIESDESHPSQNNNIFNANVHNSNGTNCHKTQITSLHYPKTDEKLEVTNKSSKISENFNRNESTIITPPLKDNLESANQHRNYNSKEGILLIPDSRNILSRTESLPNDDDDHHPLSYVIIKPHKNEETVLEETFNYTDDHSDKRIPIWNKKAKSKSDNNNNNKDRDEITKEKVEDSSKKLPYVTRKYTSNNSYYYCNDNESIDIRNREEIVHPQHVISHNYSPVMNNIEIDATKANPSSQGKQSLLLVQNQNESSVLIRQRRSAIQKPNNSNTFFSITKTSTVPARTKTSGTDDSPGRIGRAINSEILEMVKLEDQEYQKLLATKPREMIHVTASPSSNAAKSSSSRPDDPDDKQLLYRLSNNNTNKSTGGPPISTQTLPFNKNRLSEPGIHLGTPKTISSSFGSVPLPNNDLSNYNEPDDDQDSDPPPKKLKNCSSDVDYFYNSPKIKRYSKNHLVRGFNRRRSGSQSGKNNSLNPITPSSALTATASTRRIPEEKNITTNNISCPQGPNRVLTSLQTLKSFDESPVKKISLTISQENDVYTTNLTPFKLKSTPAGISRQEPSSETTPNSTSFPKINEIIKKYERETAKVAPLTNYSATGTSASPPKKNGRLRDKLNQNCQDHMLLSQSMMEFTTPTLQSPSYLPIRPKSITPNYFRTKKVKDAMPSNLNLSQSTPFLYEDSPVEQVDYLQCQLERTRSRLYKTKSENEDLRDTITILKKTTTNSVLHNPSDDLRKIKNNDDDQLSNSLIKLTKDSSILNDKSIFWEQTNFKNNNRAIKKCDALRLHTDSIGTQTDIEDFPRVRELENAVSRLKDIIKDYKLKMIEVNELADFNGVQIKVLKQQLSQKEMNFEKELNEKLEAQRFEIEKSTIEEHGIIKRTCQLEKDVLHAKINDLNGTLDGKTLKIRNYSDQLSQLQECITQLERKLAVSQSESGNKGNLEQGKMQTSLSKGSTSTNITGETSLRRSLKEALENVETLQNEKRRRDLMEKEYQNQVRYQSNSAALALAQLRGVIVDLSLLAPSALNHQKAITEEAAPEDNNNSSRNKMVSERGDGEPDSPTTMMPCYDDICRDRFGLPGSNCTLLSSSLLVGSGNSTTNSSQGSLSSNTSSGFHENTTAAIQVDGPNFQTDAVNSNADDGTLFTLRSLGYYQKNHNEETISSRQPQGMMINRCTKTTSINITRETLNALLEKLKNIEGTLRFPSSNSTNTTVNNNNMIYENISVGEFNEFLRMPNASQDERNAETVNKFVVIKEHKKIAVKNSSASFKPGAGFERTGENAYFEKCLSTFCRFVGECCSNLVGYLKQYHFLAQNTKNSDLNMINDVKYEKAKIELSRIRGFIKTGLIEISNGLTLFLILFSPMDVAVQGVAELAKEVATLHEKVNYHHQKTNLCSVENSLHTSIDLKDLFKPKNKSASRINRNLTDIQNIAKAITDTLELDILHRFNSNNNIEEPPSHENNIIHELGNIYRKFYGDLLPNLTIKSAPHPSLGRPHNEDYHHHHHINAGYLPHSSLPILNKSKKYYFSQETGGTGNGTETIIFNGIAEKLAGNILLEALTKSSLHLTCHRRLNNVKVELLAQFLGSSFKPMPENDINKGVFNLRDTFLPLLYSKLMDVDGSKFDDVIGIESFQNSRCNGRSIRSRKNGDCGLINALITAYMDQKIIEMFEHLAFHQS